MRVGEFFEAMDAYRKEAEAGRQHTGNLIRGLAARITNLLVGKKDKVKDERKYWPMPWDEPDDDGADKVARDLSALPEAERNKKVEQFLKMLDE